MNEHDEQTTRDHDGDHVTMAVVDWDSRGPIVAPHLERRLTIAATRYVITASRPPNAGYEDRFTFHCWEAEDTGPQGSLLSIHPKPELPRDAYATSRAALDAGEARLRWMLEKPEEWMAAEDAFWARVEAKRNADAEQENPS